ncbi:conserved membrane protein of unknown function,might belong to Permease [Shewanella benthica]|uniref:Uncharacterized protein n=1 Tax=Shewanella benthica TaxID=43661 RepID=A0A330M4X5_9GAMM|nr:hypothetical protein [Shewanella benthica]SQH76474.1 conserved membrane protein of unknown function,might belong to Permease [Shewanella benthica]
MDKCFLLSARAATVKNEIYAGLITFIAMSYIFAVNPAILGSIDGIDKGAIFLSGCVYLILSLTLARKVVTEATPENFKLGNAVGLGLFVSFLGFHNAGNIVSAPFISSIIYALALLFILYLALS